MCADGFVGVMVDNHVEDKGPLGRVQYDAPKYDPVWRMAEMLFQPIYLHPMFPPGPLAEAYTVSHILPNAAASLGTSGWGWHSECGLHVLKLFAAGVFDRFPKLRIIVGHFGEMLPFMLQRICQLSGRWGVRQRDFATVWRENIWITTSGVWSVDPMAMIQRNTSVEKVMFSIDTPFAKAEDGKRFWEDLCASRIYDEKELENIGWKNAARIFHLDEEQLIQDAEKFLN
jgi:predicted TIM-barrel fold metal-dependent hydrolase